ncbi:HU family DNA-binding protein [Pseudotabrizicola sp. L79]|uniref:HU family DNA-binding protein n=1 Tax=Pseudotabrizicola sp. L79 TaxID=3118402 RepID=UPI002F92C509
MSTRSKYKSGPKGIPAPKPQDVAAAPIVDAGADVDTLAADQAEDAEASTKDNGLKLRDLVNRVVDATGAKKKDVKPVVEATLEQLGAALAKGEELNLPGMGKVRVARSIDKDGRTMMTLKVRGPGAPKEKEAKEALADTEEAV